MEGTGAGGFKLKNICQRYDIWTVPDNTFRNDVIAY